MGIVIRSYRDKTGYTDDFNRVCDFLIRINREKTVTPNYLWARWVWQFGPYMDMDYLACIGVAEDDGLIVGLVTYEGTIGEAYFCVDENYGHIKPLLLEYAKQNLSCEGRLKIILPDGDLSCQRLAVQSGFVPTGQKEAVAMLDIHKPTYALPAGYHIMSFDDKCFDVDRYYNAIWRGFDNQRPRNTAEIKSMEKREGFDAPHLDLSLRILVVAPNGDYAAHCGMWHIPNSAYAYVEPVFTLPEYRKMGLGKAAVLEGVNRCGRRGAKRAYVGSSQQFYYQIGFYPVHNETWWVYSAE